MRATTMLPTPGHPDQGAAKHVNQRSWL